MAIMTKREGLGFQSEIKSDTAALNSLVEKIVEAGAADIHAMRDPTRGGLAASLNEFATSSQVTIRVKQDLIPILRSMSSQE